MNNLIAFGLRLTGVKKLWDMVNGYKTYIGAVSLLLLGFGKILIGISGLLAVLASCGDLACGVELVRGLSQSDPNVASIVAGWVAIGNGLIGLGLRHAQSKK